MCRHQPAEGIEKRGVIAYGWTPPENSPVKIEPGKPWPDSSDKTAGSLSEAELEIDLAKRLAEEAAKRLKK